MIRMTEGLTIERASRESVGQDTQNRDVADVQHKQVDVRY